MNDPCSVANVPNYMPKPKSSSAKKPVEPKGPVLSEKVRHALIHGLIAFIVILVGAGGLYALRKHVWQEIAFVEAPPKIVLKNRPAWMGDFLVEQITKAVRPAGTHSAMDAQLLRDTHALLVANPWVSEVHNIRRTFGEKPGDTLEIDCEFRAPVALVKWNAHYWLVDGNGVKLPEEYTADIVPKVVLDRNKRTNIRIIDGVQSPPPAAGEQWPGADLIAGLDMIRLLFNEPYADDIVKVNVANYAGRVDVREAQVVLITKWDTQVRWGRPANASDFFIEAPTARKLEYLRAIYAEHKRLDANEPWIDIRFDQPTRPAPTTPTSASAAVR